MRQGWMTNDGRFFEHYTEAVKHEQVTGLREKLEELFNEHIEYSSDAGYACATSDEVADIIVGNLDKFLLALEDAYDEWKTDEQ